MRMRTIRIWARRFMVAYTPHMFHVEQYADFLIFPLPAFFLIYLLFIRFLARGRQ